MVNSLFSKNKGQSSFVLSVKSTEAFTLIELVIALAIIGIIAFFSVPNIIEYSKHQKESERKSHEDAISDALRQCYALEGRYPKEIYTDAEYSDYNNDGSINWIDYLSKEYFVTFDNSLFVYSYTNGNVAVTYK